MITVEGMLSMSTFAQMGWSGRGNDGAQRRQDSELELDLPISSDHLVD